MAGPIELSGHINDAFPVESFPIDGPVVVISLRNVTGINSNGVRRFIELVGRCDWRRLEFREAPSVMLSAFAVIPSLLGRETNIARVTSFLVPYMCRSCGDELQVPVRANEVRVERSLLVQSAEITVTGNEISLPPRTCPRCGTAMEHDETTIENIRELVVLKAIVPEPAPA